MPVEKATLLSVFVPLATLYRPDVVVLDVFMATGLAEPVPFVRFIPSN